MRQTGRQKEEGGEVDEGRRVEDETLEGSTCEGCHKMNEGVRR